MPSKKEPIRRSWIVLPPEVIVIPKEVRATSDAEIKNPVLICAQDGQHSITQIGAKLAAWAYQAEEGEELTLRTLELTDAEAGDIAAADNPAEVISEKLREWQKEHGW